MEKDEKGRLYNGSKDEEGVWVRHFGLIDCRSSMDGEVLARARRRAFMVARFVCMCRQKLMAENELCLVAEIYEMNGRREGI